MNAVPNGNTLATTIVAALQPERLRRHLASPDDVFAAMQNGAISPGGRFTSRTWSRVRHVDVSFVEAGFVGVPASSVYLIATVIRGSAQVTGSATGHARLVREGTTIVHTPGQGFRCAWSAACSLAVVCLDPQVVATAAHESGIGLASGLNSAGALELGDPICEHLLKVVMSEAALDAPAAQPMIVDCVASALALRIAAARAAQSGGPARIPNGRVLRGSQINVGWSWHVQDVEFAESTIEPAMDGTDPSYRGAVGRRDIAHRVFICRRLQMKSGLL